MIHHPDVRSNHLISLDVISPLNAGKSTRKEIEESEELSKGNLC